MSNKTKMIFKSVFNIVMLMLLAFVLISEDFMTLKWYEMSLLYGITLYFVCTLWTCLSYWTVYICGKENITVSDYEYDLYTL